MGKRGEIPPPKLVGLGFVQRPLCLFLGSHRVRKRVYARLVRSGRGEGTTARMHGSKMDAASGNLLR